MILQQPTSGGSGSSTPGLPVWTYTAGAMASGKLKADGATPGLSSYIDLSHNLKSGGNVAAVLGELQKETWLVITGSGGTVFFEIDTPVITGSDVRFTSLGQYGDTDVPWSGDYQLSFLPPYDIVLTVNGGGPDADGNVVVVGPDTGWTPNESAGDKAIEVTNYTTPDFTGSDTVDSATVTALAAQVVKLTKKLQAIENALANNLRPNA